MIINFKSKIISANNKKIVKQKQIKFRGKMTYRYLAAFKSISIGIV